ncbi:hypothetical protein AB0D13_21850 [Streptomyces sp. NPDC048430]|uniref:hypothetical protein n=1 Tax=unclassified Streptomyces TaxID=2593676 RepID=UPI00342C44B7
MATKLFQCFLGMNPRPSLGPREVNSQQGNATAPENGQPKQANGHPGRPFTGMCAHPRDSTGNGRGEYLSFI